MARPIVFLLLAAWVLAVLAVIGVVLFSSVPPVGPPVLPDRFPAQHPPVSLV